MDVQAKEQIEQSKKEMAIWLTNGLAAVSFAGIIVIGKPDGLAKLTAIRLLVVAIPLLLFNVIRLKEAKKNRYSFSWLAHTIPLCGVIAAVLGFASFLWSLDHASAQMLLGLSLALAIVLATAESRAEKLHLKKLKAEAKQVKLAEKTRLGHESRTGSN